MYKERAHMQLLEDAVSWVSDLQWTGLGTRRDLEMMNREKDKEVIIHHRRAAVQQSAYPVILQQRVE